MDEQKVGTNNRLSKWEQIIQARISTGQNIKDFCESEGISRNKYFYWQKKLKERAGSELSKQAPETANESVPKGWTQLEEKKENALTIEVGGCHMSVTDKTDSELLVKVCRALKAL